jgi:rhamnulokinase
MKYCAAIDLGASSGRVSIGSLENSTLSIQEVHRFKHEAVHDATGALRWEWEKIVEEVVRGLHAAQKIGEIVSIGIDTWAVDYGLLDSDGALLEQPYCYRDSRTDGLMKSISDSLGAEWIYQRTGIQFIFFNTAYQLHAARTTETLKKAQTFLLLPDLLNFYFSGVQSCDVTNASTTQLHR